MASTYSTNLKIELIGTGDQSGTWGTTTNVNLGTAIEEAITGIATANFPADADLTLTLSNTNTTQVPRHLVLDATSGVSLTTTRNLIVPTVEKQYLVWNNTTGGQSIVVKTSAGTGITVPNGAKVHVVVDGTNVVRAFDNADINSGSIDGTPIGASSASTGNFSTLSIAGSAVTATAAELNVLDGITATTAELNYTDGVTSNIQTQLDAKAPLASPTFTGTVSATTVDTTNIEVTNLKAKDGTAAGSIADSTGVVTLASSVLTTTDINGGTIDGATIATSDITVGSGKTLDVSAGTFTVANDQISGDAINGGTATPTTLTSTTVNATTVDTTNIEVTNLKAKDGTAAGSIADATGVVTLSSSVLTTTDINGGTIDGVTIGGSSAGAGTFTALTVETTQGDITIANSASSLDFDRAGINYVRATDALGSFRFITGASDFTTNRLQIAANGDVSFYEDTGATAKFFWDASAERLGLGTTSPATALDVVGTVTADGVDSESADGLNLYTGSTYEAGWTHDTLSGISSINVGRNSTWGGSLIIRTDTKARATFASNGDIGFLEDTGTSTKFFWDASTERLGIGTTSPDNLLHVAGASTGALELARFRLEGETNNPMLKIEADEAGQTAGLDVSGSTATDLTFSTGGTERVRIDSNGDVTVSEELKAKSYNETVEAITSSGGAATINCENANLFTHVLSENVTYTFSNPPASGTGYGFTLKVVQDATARTITWPASVQWGQNLTPTISTGLNEVDVFTFFTHNGGATWYGFAAGQDMS